jgi:transcriptional regulator with XRE-family HTH domain
MVQELAALKKRIGSRIRERRDHAGLSQEDLAFQADLSPTYLSQIETGKRNPSIERLYRISTVLQIELAELFKK